MKKQQIQSATSLPPSPDEERKSRMLKYTIAMTTRLACFIVAIFIHSLWALIPIAGAILLPYFAVVVANTVVQPRVNTVERPGSLVTTSRPHPGSDA